MTVILTLASKDDPTRGMEWIEGVTILLAVILIVVVTAANNWTKVELRYCWLINPLIH